MKVKRLTMNSFRGISDLTLEFHETEPTVFIGINGVGKSSILDCLSILLSWLIAQLQFDPNAVGSFMSKQDGPLVSGRQQDLANGRIFGQKDIKNGENKTHNEIAISLNSQEVKWSINTFQIGGNTGLGLKTALVELEPVTNNIRRHWEENPEANIPLVVYYPVNRAVLNIPLETPKEEYSFKQVDAYEQALNGIQINFSSFFQWFRTVEDLENEERRDNPDYRNRQLEAVRQAIYSLLPGFSNLRVRRSPSRMTITKQGQELIVNQLSDGEKCLLALAGDLARRLAIANPGLADPLQGSGVVLIDEIELHLHPAWQRKVIPVLTDTFRNCQFIVTTHSPQVLSQVKPDGIYIRYSGSGEILPTDDPDKQAAAITTIEKLGLDIDKLRAMRREAIDGVLLAIDGLTDEEIQQLAQGYAQPDANGRYTPFCAAIAYILQLYFIT
jgi:predicted ATP-binding protein involved in virulence